LKKQLIFLALIFSYGMGWFAFLHSEAIHTVPVAQDQEFLFQSTEFNSNHFMLISGYSSPEVPAFKVDWMQFGKSNAQWVTDPFLQVQLKPSDFWPCSCLAQFDVKITFLQFFYTW
jgi:lipopolysaccharide export system protein LptC